jgi:hypothetical protein
MKELRKLSLNYLTNNIARVHLDCLQELEPAILVEIIHTWKAAAQQAEVEFPVEDDLPAAAQQ